MANNCQSLLGSTNDGYAPSASNNSFNSMWIDKRSAEYVAVSVVFTGASNPTGTITVWASNCPEGAQGGPANTLDAVQIANATFAVTATGSTQFAISTPARWVQVRYVASASVSGLTARVYCNVPFSSN